MQSITSSSNKNTDGNCSICVSSDVETKIILKNLLMSILNTQVKKQKINLNISQTLYLQKYDGSMIKFLNFLLHEKLFSQNENCKHQAIYQYFQQKSSYSQKQLNIICEYLYQSHAKRNFELQILTNQVKIFSKTIFQSVLSKTPTPSIQQQISVQNQVFNNDKISYSVNHIQMGTGQNMTGTFFMPILYHAIPNNMNFGYYGTYE